MLVVAAGVAACRPTPPTEITVQGRVRSAAMGVPLSDARVTIEWPASFGVPTTIIRTNERGEFAARATVRAKDVRCEGLSLTVDVPNYAAAYDKYEEDCGDRVLTFNFTLQPLPH